MGEKHSMIWSGLKSTVLSRPLSPPKVWNTGQWYNCCAVLHVSTATKMKHSFMCLFSLLEHKVWILSLICKFLLFAGGKKRSSRTCRRFPSCTIWTPLCDITPWPWTPGLCPCIYFISRIADNGTFPQIDDAIGWNGIFVCKIKFSYLKWSFSFFFSVCWFSTPVRTVQCVWHNWVLFGSKKSVHTDKGWPIKVQCNLIKMLRLTKLYFIQRGNVGKQVSDSIKKPSLLLLLQVLSNEMKPFVRSVKLFKTQNDSIRFRSCLFLSFPFFIHNKLSCFCSLSNLFLRLRL